MTWDNLQHDILEEFAGLHQTPSVPFEVEVRLWHIRKAREAARKSEWVWSRRQDPAYKERRREHCRTWRQRLKQDPLRLAEHREKERKRHKARVARMAVEEPDRLAAEKARHVQSTRAWRARQNAENREEFLAKRREYQARRKASMTPEQLQVHKEKNRARDKARRENYTEAQKERQRASWRKHREKVQADPERAEARRIKQREYSRRWREKKKRGGC